jgi:hypothetical protein
MARVVSDSASRVSGEIFDRALELLQDARKRFLAPNGVMIPRRDVLKATILEAEKVYSSIQDSQCVGSA